MTKNKDRFGPYIKKRRLTLGLTQAQVAKKSSVSQNFIAYLETNQRKPSLAMIKKLSVVLMLPTDRLFFIANTKSLEGIVDYNDKGIKAKLPPVLEDLMKDRTSREKHGVTDEEIEQLASIRARGEIKSKGDYIFLLMSIRQVFK